MREQFSCKDILRCEILIGNHVLISCRTFLFPPEVVGFIVKGNSSTLVLVRDHNGKESTHRPRSLLVFPPYNNNDESEVEE
jgi:hypothetical protein